MFHYLRNVYWGTREQPHITGWHSPPPLPTPQINPHAYNHVSSYIITFKLQECDPCLPTCLIYDICFLKDKGMPCFGRRRGKRGMQQQAVSCRGYKKGCSSFPPSQPWKSAAIFSRTYVALGRDVNTVGFGLATLGRRGEDTHQDACSKNNNPTGQVCVSLSASQPLSLHVCVCVCVCQGPSELQAFLQSHRSEEWSENTKDTLSHKSPSPPALWER